MPGFSAFFGRAQPAATATTGAAGATPTIDPSIIQMILGGAGGQQPGSATPTPVQPAAQPAVNGIHSPAPGAVTTMPANTSMQPTMTLDTFSGPKETVIPRGLDNSLGRGVLTAFGTTEGRGAVGQVASALSPQDSPAAKVGNIFVEQARLQNLLKLTKSELNKAMMAVSPDVAAASGSSGGGGGGSSLANTSITPPTGQTGGTQTNFP